jgi:hypothetical protein
MKNIRESVSFAVAVMSIVVLLGIAAWSVYVGGQALQDETPFNRVTKQPR